MTAQPVDDRETTDQLTQADDLVERLGDEADLCRNDGANDIADLLDEAAASIKELKAEVERLTAPFVCQSDIVWRPASAEDHAKLSYECEAAKEALHAADARAAKAEEALREIRTMPPGFAHDNAQKARSIAGESLGEGKA